MSTALVWLRRDLRLADHPALTAACAAHERVLPVYIHSPQEETPWAPGGASRWWLHRSLQALGRTLLERGGRLHLAAGDSLDELSRLIAQSGAAAVYWTRCYEPALMERDSRIEAALRKRGITVESRPGNLLLEPWRISGSQGRPYRVFTPFWRKLASQLTPLRPLPERRPRHWVKLAGSLELDAFDLQPRIPWAGGLARAWWPGEAGAGERLRRFGERALADYAAGRDRPAEPGTSRLSPHLHFGEITPRQIHHALLRRAARARKKGQASLEAYLRELGWREFAHHLLHHFPGSCERNFNRRFDAFRWAEPDAAALVRWQRGRTGVPLVDAGMRELWSTGWMHNRVRMIAASFLTKNLRLHWLHGARWFWDTLVDADLANNTLGWQWVAGCGADAAPYFRVFNPFTQAARFDPQAVYLKRWLPELTDLPAALLHEPWRDPDALARCGYPAPMVDLSASRQAALAAYYELARE
ncbi:MAG TPA: deoxyribodipyrimidine photo-lyase [Steroidobacteraceae bacterium]|nr:deoxyribodipyrimidine photo-lyase [Steroidobacteraceae bacterium]